MTEQGRQGASVARKIPGDTDMEREGVCPLLLCCCDQTLTKSDRGGKGFFGLQLSPSREAGQELERGRRRTLCTGPVTAFLIQPRPTGLGMTLPTVD